MLSFCKTKVWKHKTESKGNVIPFIAYPLTLTIYMHISFNPQYVSANIPYSKYSLKLSQECNSDKGEEIIRSPFRLLLSNSHLCDIKYDFFFRKTLKDVNKAIQNDRNHILHLYFFLYSILLCHNEMIKKKTRGQQRKYVSNTYTVAHGGKGQNDKIFWKMARTFLTIVVFLSI